MLCLVCLNDVALLSSTDCCGDTAAVFQTGNGSSQLVFLDGRAHYKDCAVAATRIAYKVFVSRASMS